MVLASFFESKTRDNGKPFCTLADNAPEWLQGAVRDAHQGTLPNDWIYSECRAAVEAFDEGLDAEDDVHEHAVAQVDVYTQALYQWAADMCLTDTWANAEAEAADMGWDATAPFERIASIQYCAIRYIAEVMRSACVEAEKEAAE